MFNLPKRMQTTPTKRNLCWTCISDIANEPVYSEMVYCPEEEQAVNDEQSQQQQKVQNYPISKLADPRLLKKLQLDNTSIESINDIDIDKEHVHPVIVTATSSRQFTNTRIWLKGLQEKNILSKYKVIIYDLGVTTDEKHRVSH